MSVPYTRLALAVLGLLLVGQSAIAEEPQLPAEFFYEGADCQAAGGACIEPQRRSMFRCACDCCLHKLEHLVNLKACWKRHWRLHQPYLSTYEPEPPFCQPNKGYYTTCWRRLEELPRCPPAGAPYPPESVWTPVVGPEFTQDIPPAPGLNGPVTEHGPASDSMLDSPHPLTPPVPDPGAKSEQRPDAIPPELP